MAHKIIIFFSRCILAAKASLTKSSAFAVENLMNAVQSHNLFEHETPIHLLVDGGSENKGRVDDFLKQCLISISNKNFIILKIRLSGRFIAVGFECAKDNMPHDAIVRQRG